MAVVDLPSEARGMDETAIREALRLTDTADTRDLARAWDAARPSWNGSEIVPFIAEAFVATTHARARACQIFQVTRFARDDDRAIELGARALSDRASDVRSRACMLMFHSRKPEVVPILRAAKVASVRLLARRAATSILEGTPFVGDADPLYFFFRAEGGRAPRGSFAHEVDRASRAALEKQRYRALHLFAHTIAFRRDDTTLHVSWDGYDMEAHLGLYRAGKSHGSALVRGGEGDIAEIARAMVAMSTPGR